MYGFHRKRGHANRYIFGAFRRRRAIPDPLSRVRDHRLPGVNVKKTALVLHPECTFEDHGEFVESRSLPRLYPAAWALHVGHASLSGLRIYAADVLVDQLGFVSGGRNARGLRDQSRGAAAHCLTIISF